MLETQLSTLLSLWANLFGSGRNYEWAAGRFWCKSIICFERGVNAFRLCTKVATYWFLCATSAFSVSLWL